MFDVCNIKCFVSSFMCFLDEYTYRNVPVDMDIQQTWRRSLTKLSRLFIGRHDRCFPVFRPIIVRLAYMIRIFVGAI